MLKWLYSKGFFHLLSVNFLAQFLGFGTVLIFPKLLTAVEIGQLRILQTYTGLFAVLAGFGLSTSLLKYCAEDRAEEELQGLLRLALRRSLLTSGTVTLILTVLALGGLIVAAAELRVWLSIYAISIPFNVLSALFITYLQARKRVREMGRSQAIIRLQSFVVVIAATFLWGFPGLVLSSVVASFIGLVPLVAQVGSQFLHAPRVATPPRFTEMAVFSMLANGMYMLGNFGDIVLLDHLVDDRETIGYYSLATLFLLAASQVVVTVQSIVTPYFAQNAHRETWFRAQLWRNQFRLVALSVAVATACLISAWFLVRFFYGDAFRPMIVFLAILMLKYVLNAAYSVMGPAVLAIGQVKYNFLVVAITTPLGLALAYVLIVRHGIIGAAWAQAVAAGLNLLLMLATTHRALRSHFANQQLLAPSPTILP